MHSLVVTEVKMLPGDGNGLVTKHRSCLKALVAQSYTPPLSYTDMQVLVCPLVSYASGMRRPVLT